MSRTPHLVIHEAEIEWIGLPPFDANRYRRALSARPHYVTKVGANGETVWTSQVLHDRSGAVRYARREAAAHTVPLRIHRPWLGDEWVPVKGDPDPERLYRTGPEPTTAGRYTYRAARGFIREVVQR